MSKKQLPILFTKFMFKMVNQFFDKEYVKYLLVCFSVCSLTRKVSHGYIYVHILAYTLRIQLFTEHLKKKIHSIYMLNMFTFDVFSSLVAGQLKKKNFILRPPLANRPIVAIAQSTHGDLEQSFVVCQSWPLIGQ